MSRLHTLFRIATITVPLLVIVVVIGLTLAWQNRSFRRWLMSVPVSTERIATQLGGSRVVSTLRQPDKVEAVLLQRPVEGASNQALDYVESSASVIVPSGIAADIAKILTTEHRQFPGMKSCIVSYGVRLRYIAGDNRVDIYLCFECAILQVLLNDVSVGGMNFDLVWPRLMEDVRQIFPEDACLIDLANEHSLRNQ